MKVNPVTLKDIGLNSDDRRVIIQESLSSSNSAIFRKAVEFKREKPILSVHTQNGFVKIKPDADSKLFIINNMQHLLQLDLKVKVLNIKQNKRKFNRSTGSNNSFTENDQKILKTSNRVNNCNILNSTISEMDMSINSSTLTVIENNPSRQDTPQRKASTGTLDEFVIRK